MIRKVDESHGKGTDLDAYAPQVQLLEIHFVDPRSGRSRLPTSGDIYIPAQKKTLRRIGGKIIEFVLRVTIW